MRPLNNKSLPKSTGPIVVRHNENNSQTVSNLMKGLMTMELFKLNGDLTKYSRFISTFETTVEAIEDNDLRKLLYLTQYCSDKVKPLIEFCLLLEPSSSIVKAKVLHESFGRKNVIARAYVKRLIKGLSLKHDNAKKDLISFSREIEECLVTLTHLKYFLDLNSF